MQKIILYDANNQSIKATKLYHSYFGNRQAGDATCRTSNLGRIRLDSFKNFGITDNDSLPPCILEYEIYPGIYLPLVLTSKTIGAIIMEQ